MKSITSFLEVAFSKVRVNIVNHANFARKYGVAAFNNSGKYKLTDYIIQFDLEWTDSQNKPNKVG